MLEQNTISIGFHTGNIVARLAMLFSPEDAIAEPVQNALDKRASHILIRLYMGNKKNLPGRISIYDNGEGASLDEIRQKFEHIGLSSKAGNNELIGEQGIGNLAPLAIGEQYSLTTQPKGLDEPYFRVSLERKKLLGYEEVQIEPTLLVSRRPNLEGYTSLVQIGQVDARWMRQLSDLDLLAGRIADEFSAEIQSMGSDITIERYARKSLEGSVKVQPVEFPGHKQEPVEVATPFGPVVFELSTTIIPHSQPKILVQRGKFSFPLKGINQGSFSRAYSEVLGSGYLHGKIKLNFGELTPDRKDLAFNKERSTLMEAIEMFCRDYRVYIDKLRTEARYDSFAAIIEEAILPIGQYFKLNPEELPDHCQAVISQGHIRAEKGVEAGNFSKITKPRRKRQKSPTRKPPSLGQTKDQLKERAERRMIHINVAQPKGQGYPRNKLPKYQPGLTVALVEGNEKLGYNWRSRFDGKNILINIDHRDWAKATDRGKTFAIKYAQVLILGELTYLKEGAGFAAESQFRSPFQSVFMDLFSKTILE